MGATSAARLLIVDDEEAQVEALCNTLSDRGYLTTGFTSGEDALAALGDHEFDLVLTDLMMPGIDGIELIRRAHELDRHLVAVVMTGHGTIDTAVEAMKAGALDYIVKPFRLSAILPVLSRALSVRHLRMENIQLREAVGMYELSMTMAFTRDFDVVLQQLADAAYQQSDNGSVAILLPGRDETVFQVAAARGGDDQELASRSIAMDGSLSQWVERWREYFSGPEAKGSEDIACEHPFRAITSGIALPMLAGGKLVGVLTFASGQLHRPISLGQVKALNILAGTAAAAMAGAQLFDQLRMLNEELEQRVVVRTQQLQEKNKQIEEELKMARELQMAMLPNRFPCVPRDATPAQSALRFYSIYRPAGSVSGDFFDVFPLADSSVGVFISDVMGHDVRAALVTAMMRALVQELSATFREPGDLLSEVNRHLTMIFKHADPIMFATASYMVVNPSASQLLFANAGHPAPIHLDRRRREASPICHNGDSGPALGLFEGAVYKTSKAPLAAGDCLMLFTDGVFEVEAANEEIYSQERLRNSILQKSDLPAEELLNRLLSEIRQFSGQRAFADDICLLAVEVMRVEQGWGNSGALLS